MTADVWASNLVAGWIQIGVITLLAALLLRVAPMRSPRMALSYLQALLTVCLLLPAIEPWRTFPVTSRISGHAVSALRFSTASAVHISLSKVLFAVLAAGVVCRLTWLAVGYLRLHRYRRNARPLEQAGVYVSPDISGPVTFGILRPAVLLPSRWLALNPGSRAAILCHELLHVQRKDWLFHLAEEIIRAALWFHPAVWWLISEIRLAREQVVDQLVVSFTGHPRSYVEVLMDFAGIDSPVTAPAFTHKRHLTRRIKSILEEVSMTKSRSITSLASITLCLAAAGAVAVWSFPLESVTSTFIAKDDSAPAAGIVGIIGGVPGGVVGGVPGGVVGGVIGGVPGGVIGGVPGAQTVGAGPQESVHRLSEKGLTPPKVLSKVDPEYTKEAKDAKIEGTVVFQMTVRPDGHAHDIRIVRSLDSGLDEKAREAIENWEFEPGKKDGKPVAVLATIEVNFKLN